MTQVTAHLSYTFSPIANKVKNYQYYKEKVSTTYYIPTPLQPKKITQDTCITHKQNAPTALH